MPPSREKELGKALEALEMAKLRLEGLSRQAEMLQASINEHARAISTIKAVSTAREGTEILVPIGAGALVHARTTGAAHAILAVGAGVSIEKSLDEALAKLEKDSAELELAERKVIQELRNVEKQAGLLSQRIQALQSEIEKGAPREAAGEEE